MKGSNVVIAKIDASANTLPDEIQVTGFPTIVLFQGKTQTPYAGAREAKAFTDFLRTTFPAVDKEDL